MTTAFIIWLCCGLIYLLFLAWYVGFRKKITPEEVIALRELLQEHIGHSPRRIEGICKFFENDDGKDFVMVNLLEYRKPHKESLERLRQYQKVFLGNLLKRAGHPIFFTVSASNNIENIDCESDKWSAAGMVRYRSRRDLLEVIPETLGSDHHKLKLEALQRTFAFAGTPWKVAGGPRLLVPLALALIGALAQLSLT